MGGRGAGSGKFDGSKPFAVKTASGQIDHIRKVNENDYEYGSGGHMWKELGSSEWRWSREPISNVLKNNKAYSLNAKAVNPKNYINSSQRWKNNESKERLTKLREGRKSGRTSNYGLPVRSSHLGNVTYKNGKKVVNSEYKQRSIRNAYESKQADLKRARSDIAFSGNFTGGASRSEMRKVVKLQKAVNKLGKLMK